MKRSRLTDSVDDVQESTRNEHDVQPSPPPLANATKAENLRTFPYRLFSFLSDSQYESAIKWSTDGKSFGVTPLEFTNQILNVHFRGSQIDSFIRKLNRWSFTRNSINSEFPIYAVVHSHPFFQRDHPELLEKMTCVSKNKKRKQRPSHAEETKEAAVPPQAAPTGGVADHLTNSLLNRLGIYPDPTSGASLAQNIRLNEILNGGMPRSDAQRLLEQQNLLSLASQRPQAVLPIESLLLLEQERLAMTRNRSFLAPQSNQMDYLLLRATNPLLLGPAHYSRLFQGGFEPSTALGGLPNASLSPVLLSQQPGPIARMLSSRYEQARAHSAQPQNSGSPSSGSNGFRSS